jgi:hypothetical protein
LNRHAGDARAARVADALNANFYAAFHTAFIGRINAGDRNLPVHDKFGFAALEFDFEVVAAVQRGCPVTVALVMVWLRASFIGVCPSPTPLMEAGKMRGSVE